MHSISRRLLICGGTASGVLAAGNVGQKSEDVYRFTTREWDIHMTMEFHDRYSSKRFGFREQRTNRRFCLSGDGGEGTNCLTNFVGSIAIARYQIHARGSGGGSFALREKVRTIDADTRLPNRPPFERTLKGTGSVVSDIQAFGYEATAATREEAVVPVSKEVWSLLRQDLYFAGQSAPFLMIHWKHTLSAIRVLDIIPGEETSWMNEEA